MHLSELGVNNPDILVGIARMIFIWSFANYATNADPLRPPENSPLEVLSKRWVLLIVIRSLLAGATTYGVLGQDPHAALVSAIMTTGCLLLPLARLKLVSASYAAELETGVTLGLPITMASLQVHWGVQGQVLLPGVMISKPQIAVILFVAAVTVFSVRGGTYIVRGVLNKCGALPPLNHQPQPNVDAKEFNRGRWIGNLERILLLAIVAEHNYGAIAFLMAAKSLIRSKELEDRAWAEYFLLGTLTSIMVALACGFTIGRSIEAFWR